MQFVKEEHRIYAENGEGKLLAEITFPQVREGVVEIDHTFVDASLRGQGVAGQLVEAAAEQLRAQGRKAVATCPYAVSWFAANPGQADVLEETVS